MVVNNVYGFLQKRNFSEEREKSKLLVYFCWEVKRKQKNYVSCIKITGALCCCNLHLAQQIVILTMPLILVPPLYQASYYA